MEKRICRLCGKEGALRAALIKGNKAYVLSHYCPVKAARKREKKKKEEADYIAWILRDPESRIGLPGDLEEDLFKLYPCKFSSDPFARTTPEVEKHNDKFKELWEKYVAFIQENKRYPNKREKKKLLKEI